MNRDQLNRHKTATYVMPRHRAVYVSVNKAACTSLKWLVADLQGEDPERFHRALSQEVGRSMTIHGRRLWQHTPMLHGLGDEELAAIGPEHGWFIFAVVRHPGARLFSAWQSKFLLREPRWAAMYGGEPWFPRVPSSTEDVVADFRRFVRALAGAPRPAVLRDRHFMDQCAMLAPERMPYSRIYTTAEIPVLLGDLESHLRAQGWAGELELRRFNETPLLPTAAMFDAEVRAAVTQLYGADLERFGFSSAAPDRLHAEDDYPPAAFAEIERLVERHERIGDLALRAQGLRRAQRRAATPPATTAGARSLSARIKAASTRLRAAVG
jgi:hypothetical protein